jgi:hypothetical protein
MPSPQFLSLFFGESPVIIDIEKTIDIIDTNDNCSNDF